MFVIAPSGAAKPAALLLVRSSVISSKVRPVGSRTAAFPGVDLPPPHSDIDVVGVDLQRPRPAAGALGSDQHRAAASGEGVEHEAVPLGAVLDGVRHQGDGLDRLSGAAITC